MRGPSSPSVAELRRALAASNLEITLVETPLYRPSAAGEAIPTVLVLLTNQGPSPFFEVVKLFTHPSYGALRRSFIDLATGAAGSRYVILASEGPLSALIDPSLPAEAFTQLGTLPLDLVSGQIAYNYQRGRWELSAPPPSRRP